MLRRWRASWLISRKETGDRGQGPEENGRQETGDGSQETRGSGKDLESNNKQIGPMIMAVRSAKELEVYKKAYALAMDIFIASKTFPDEERYALTSQIRRSSRSVSMNLREAWSKRRYEAHFVSKLTDCDGECNRYVFGFRKRLRLHHQRAAHKPR